MFQYAVPAACAVLFGLAVKNSAAKSKGMTPERQKVYEVALVTLTDPDQLQKLGEAYVRNGCKAEGEVLLSLASYMRLPKEKKAEYRGYFKTGLACTDPDKVDAMADWFQKKGAVGMAGKLREYAAGLRKAEAA